MKLIVCAGPTTTGKTSVLRHLIGKIKENNKKVAFMKIDVQYADEDEKIADEFKIPTKKVYSGELCPDHCSVMVLGDAIKWANDNEVDVLLVETAGLCLRCSPYTTCSLGVVVLEATSGMNLPFKVGPILSLADIAVITKSDCVSQAEREVFAARISEVAPSVNILEVNGIYGIGIDSLYEYVMSIEDLKDSIELRGNPPVGTCTICVGKKDIGWQNHFGVVRTLENQVFYRGE